MLASLLLPLLVAWEVPADPSVPLPSFNRMQLAEAYNKSAELWSSVPLNKSSRVINSLASDTVIRGVRCLSHLPREEPPRQEPVWVDCLNAVWKILEDGVDPRTRRTIRRHVVNPDRDYLVPNVFTWRSCIIIVDTLEENDYDILSMLDIRNVALDIMEKCLKHRPYLGGSDLVGPKHVTMVLLCGSESETMTGTAEVS